MDDKTRELIPYGYAPGDYMIRCLDCGAQPYGCDKRAGRCRPCAEKRWNAAKVSKCNLCGEPMPHGEEMFKYHGYSGPCPKPPLPKQETKDLAAAPTPPAEPDEPQTTNEWYSEQYAQSPAPTPTASEPDGRPTVWMVRRHDAPKYWIPFMHTPVDAMKDPEREVVRLYWPPAPTPPEQADARDTSAAFDAWWDAGNLMKANPYNEGTPAFWAWEGWWAAMEERK